MPEQCDHDRAIGLADGSPHGREDGEIEIFENYLENREKDPTVGKPGVISVENYALFVWGSQAVPQ